MTPVELQDELAEEIRCILDGHTYKKPTEPLGEEPGGSDDEASARRTAIRVFTQDVPILETDNDADPIPYVIVRLRSGSDDGTRESFNEVSLIIIIGLWDDSLDQQGYRDVMSIIQKIYHRFHTDPNLNGKAAYSGSFKWAVQEDGYFPYFFGACNMTFRIAAVRREDRFA